MIAREKREIIETYFQECREFFFPLAANEINWTKGYTFLDKELQKTVTSYQLPVTSYQLPVLPVAAPPEKKIGGQC